MARKYYYDNGETKVGPVDGEELLRLRASGALAEDTWVRTEDSSTWRPLGSLDLHKEEMKAANPSLWRMLLRNMPLHSCILAGAVFIVLLAVLLFFIGALWPLLLVMLLGWLLMSALRRL